jgi:glycosyltransferase involved in cell wall biosynthesis
VAKVSIIIPVFNTEKYLEKAILSIVDQTLPDIEIIIINDGSTDNSLQIIGRIAESDERIKFFNQENKGQAVARNVGLGKAIGEYIYFMDSDDYLEPEALSACYEQATGNGLDFVFFDAEYLIQNNGLSLPISYDRRNVVDPGLIYSGIDVMEILLDAKAYQVPPWLSFINRKFLIDKNIGFITGLLHEDQIFTSMLYLNAQKVGYIPKAFFKRRLREESIMTKKYSIKNIETYFVVAEYLLVFSQNKNEQIRNIIDKNIAYSLNPAIYMANSLPRKQRLWVFKECWKKYRKYISLKSWLVLLFPILLKIKSKLKRKQIMKK